MITTADIGNMLFSHCKQLQMCDVYQKGNVPLGKVEKERIVVCAKSLSEDTEWEKCYVEVNYLVPDRDEQGNENLIRLEEVERVLKEHFKSQVLEFKSNWCLISWESIEKLRNNGLNSAYINVRVVVERLNI